MFRFITNFGFNFLDFGHVFVRNMFFLSAVYLVFLVGVVHVKLKSARSVIL